MEEARKSLSEIRGTVIRPCADRQDVEILDMARIQVDPHGMITDVTPRGMSSTCSPTLDNVVWLPGFIDTHIHCPQFRVLGSASGPLLEWLEQSIFPEEARFSSDHYAREVAQEFCSALARNGTTTAAVYSSSHPGATDILFETFANIGLRGLIGLTLMDQNAPDEVLLDVDSAMQAAEQLADRWHGYDDRLEFCVTPRFAVSCSPEMMRRAAEFAQRRQLPIQTHLSENSAELEAVQNLYPEAKDYLDVYEQMGLVGSRSIFAHCIHLSEPEWERMSTAQASVSHCPDSNFFLGSGLMPLDTVRRHGVKMGLGTDVGAGRSMSIRQTMASAYDTALLTDAKTSSGELLWYATAGGASALGLNHQIGYIAPGYHADLIAVEVPSHVPRDRRLLDAIAFRRDHGAVKAIYVRGRAIHV